MVTWKTGKNLQNGSIGTEIRRIGEWENGRMGEWENGRMGVWENGRMGEWEKRGR